MLDSRSPGLSFGIASGQTGLSRQRRGKQRTCFVSVRKNRLRPNSWPGLRASGADECLSIPGDHFGM